MQSNPEIVQSVAQIQQGFFDIIRVDSAGAGNVPSKQVQVANIWTWIGTS